MTTFGGLLVHRPCWTLSLRGKLLLLVLAAALSVAVLWETYPFLAVNQPVNAEVLVVEGWLPTEMLKEAADEFAHGKYRRLLVIRSVYDAEQVPANGSFEWVAADLVYYGVPRQSLDTLFCLSVHKDRTYHAALTVKDWFTKNGRFPKSFNVATAGPHARRSWLLYQKAFGNTAQIGIVALEDRSYDPKDWWSSSEGVREVLSEAIAYVYAKFFFGWTQEPLSNGRRNELWKQSRLLGGRNLETTGRLKVLAG